MLSREKTLDTLLELSGRTAAHSRPELLASALRCALALTDSAVRYADRLVSRALLVISGLKATLWTSASTPPNSLPIAVIKPAME